MITIKWNNQDLSIPVGTTPLSLLPDEDKKKYYVCLVNGRVRELTYPLTKNAILLLT